MYVIFPADEVVCLSYGRVIYIPATPSDRRVTIPIRASLSTGSYTSSVQPSTSTTVSSHGSNQSFEAPVAPPRLKKSQQNTKVEKKTSDRRLSYSDYLAVGRDRSPSTRLKCKCDSSSVNTTKSRKNKNLGRDRTSYDFEQSFAREKSPAIGSTKSSASSQRLPEKSSPTKKRPFFAGTKKRPEMATNECVLKDLTHPGYNEQLKLHNSVSFKLVRTVSEYTTQLGQLYEKQAQEIQALVSTFRKKNGELRKERAACPSSLFHTWETFLQETELDSQALGDIGSILGRQVARPLVEKSFRRKIEAKKIFQQRESYDTIIVKTEEKLIKCRQEYKAAYMAYLTTPTTQTLSAYFNAHNAFVQQLHATNGMLEEYGKVTLPTILQELEDIYLDVSSMVTEAILQSAEIVSSRATEQCKRYEGLTGQSRSVSGTSDLAHFSRSLPAPQGQPLPTRKYFTPLRPQTDNSENQEIPTENLPPPLKDELVIDRLSALQIKPSHEALKKEAADLESQIRQIQDAVETLVRVQQRSTEAALYNKANEIQEDISMKKFDYTVAKLHLSAINAQKELFSNKLEGETGRERKMSSASTGSMKNKWLRAFKSLKSPPPETEKKNGSAATRELLKGDPDAHNFQEYTYKKITPCDVCSQVLRGHTRQGLKCRICKMNVHLDCQEKASKCQTKARLLRRQKSTSEIETRVPEPTPEEEKSPEVDQIYQVLKQATEISNSKQRINADLPAPPGITVERTTTGSNPASTGSSGQSLNRRNGPPARIVNTTTNLTVINQAPCSTSSDRRQTQGTSGQLESSSMKRRIFAGMKSLTGFGSRSRHGSPGHRSISLPERTSMKSPSGAVTYCLNSGYNNFAPHSPRRQKLNLRMKSLSLDSPESTEHVQRRKHHGAHIASDPHSNQGSSSRIQFSIPARSLHNHHVGRSDLKAKSTPSSPVHNRRLLSAKNIRMSSVELPDENEKSPSSASASPCPSPVGAKKSHRLLPTNLYVVLYNFKSRHPDEIDLKAGDKITAQETSDPEWWRGKCFGRVGLFPKKYVAKLSPGEKPLQVTHNLQVSDGDNGLMLLRDQIVIQIGEELDGMVMIRSGDNRQGVCPVKFLQEV